MPRLLSFLLLASLSAVIFAAADTKPNVLLIVADDLGLQLSCYGDRHIATPHLDALAEAGTRFETAYVTQASCSPSRVSIFTGLFPHTHGHIGLAKPNNPPLRKEFHRHTLPALMKSAGYRTGIIGKLHVKPKGAFRFDLSLNAGLGPNGGREVRAMADAAATFIAAAPAKPFFLMMSYVDPHHPFAAQMDGMPESPTRPGEVPTWPFHQVKSDAVLKEATNARTAIERLIDPPEWELYDLQGDPWEFRNLAADPAHAKTLKRMQHLLRKWRHDTRDPFLDHAVLAKSHAAINGPPGPSGPPGKPQNLDTLVEDTHQASLAAREKVLRKTVTRNSSWPDGVWGEVLWCLAALHLDVKTELANERLLARANAYIAHKKTGKDSSKFEPGETGETPWAYFAITDYVRILCLFRADSPHFPGRLQPATEAAMKEALWHWVKTDSKLDHTTMRDLLLLLGTENHDLTRRPNHYLIASILKDDPAYRNRSFDDGHTAAEHAEAYRKFYQAWPRMRARTGMWFELGSDTYQKYSWPALFNLHELAPDELVRKRFGMLLDLAFIEEAQISVRGRRGGGRSRAGYGKHSFTSYKDLLYVPEDGARGATHSNVLETSRYQLPAAAILLRKQVFPTSRPFAIRNRVLGELEPARPGDPGNRYAADSALVNYAWRTPHYLLGSTLQNPSLTMPDPEGGAAIVKYGGISIQNRWCGLLFDNPASDEVCAVYPVIDKTRGGRPQHPHWSVQFQNVLLLQRIPPQTRKRPGSYSTGAVGIRFHGQELRKTEKNDWIFASDGKAFAGVKFLDGPHEWNEDRTEARPASFKHSSDTSRILLHAGDVSTHQSFENFRATVLANPLKTSADKVDYHFDSKREHLEATLFHPDRPEQFLLPRINGSPVNLRPPMTYESPFLNGRFGSDKVTITVGPIKRVLDFSR